MQFVTITIFAVTGQLVSFAISKPIPSWKAGGMAIPLTRHSSSLTSHKTIDLDAISSHGVSIREKILRGLDNYEMNTGTMHPFAVKRIESGLGTRGASVPLTTKQDSIWMAEISIGTPPETLNVQIDTGSGDMWVLQTGCAGISGDHNFWYPHLSDTSQYKGQSVRLKYEDGTIVEGDLYADNVTIVGFTADPQIFGSVLSYTSPIQNNGYSDGLLGLAFSSISKLGAEPLFESLVRQNMLINPIFSLKLTPSGAEMHVGGTNNLLYKGNIVYTRITNPGYWQVSMDDVRVDGNKILENVPVILDSGSAFIFGDWDRVSEFYKAVGGTVEEHESMGYYYLPCDSFQTVIFTFGGAAFTISPKILRLGPVKEGSPNCFSAIIADRSYTSSGFWTVGLTFLASVYTVFDYGNSRVGFAELA